MKPPLDCDAVLVDATGTLFHPSPCVGAVYARVAAAHGWQADAAALDEGFRAAWRERAPGRYADDPERRTSDAVEKAWWRGTVRRTFELAGFPPPDAACFKGIFDAFADPAAWRLFPDALPALEALRQRGLTLGIVSNFDTRLRRICDGLGLTRVVDFVLPSAEAGVAKPSPRIFEAAAGLAGTEPARTLMVGDSPDDDVAGARAAGCLALLLDRQVMSPLPDAIRSLAELLPLVRARTA